MSRRWAMLFSLWTSACASVMPMETASTVPAGGYRISAQASNAVWCGVGVEPASSEQCGVVFHGVPSPQLRASARHGVVDGFDVGASLGLSADFGGPAIFTRTAALVDGKWVIFSGEHDVLSIGVGAAFAGTRATGGTYDVEGDADFVLPLRYGRKTERGEWVFSLTFDEQLQFVDPDDSGMRVLENRPRYGLGVGWFSPGSTRLGVELSYLAELTRPGAGAFVLAAGVLFDIVPPPTEAP